MKKKIFAIVLIAIMAFVALGCGEDNPPEPAGFKWDDVSEIAIANQSVLSKEYDISEFAEEQKNIMVTVTLSDGSSEDFPLNDEHFVIPDADKTKLQKAQRVRVHLSVVDHEETEITFYLVMVSYQAQEEQAIEGAKDNFVMVYRENGYLVFKLMKAGTTNGGHLVYSYDSSKITLGDVENSLLSSDEYSYAQYNTSTIDITFAAESFTDGTILARIAFSGSYRDAKIESTSSKLANYQDGSVVDIPDSNITYYTSLK